MRYIILIISIILTISLFVSLQQTQESHFDSDGNHLYPFNMIVSKIDNNKLYLDVSLIPNGLLKIDKNDIGTSVILLINDINSVIPYEKIIFLVPQNRFENTTDVIWVNQEPIVIDMKGKPRYFPFDTYITKIIYRLKYKTKDSNKFTDIDHASTFFFKNIGNFRIDNVKFNNNSISLIVKRSYFTISVAIALFLFCLAIVVSLYIDANESIKLHELLAMIFTSMSIRMLLLGMLDKITLLDALLILLFLIGINYKIIKEIAANLICCYKKLIGR